MSSSEESDTPQPSPLPRTHTKSRTSLTGSRRHSRDSSRGRGRGTGSRAGRRSTRRKSKSDKSPALSGLSGGDLSARSSTDDRYFLGRGSHDALDSARGMTPRTRRHKLFRRMSVLDIPLSHSEDNIRVAVRVRPFIHRELELDSERVVRMDGQITTIVDPRTGEEKPFTFDHSFWSFNETDGELATQSTIWKQVGRTLLKHAWQGYNCSCFAYGQTGSGKSYTIIGNRQRGHKNRGLVPRMTEALFDLIERERNIKKSPDVVVQYTVEASMIEIYNNKVRDLCNPKNNPPQGLRIRNHPKTGPYVEKLSSNAVSTYEELDALMQEGMAVRTVASTNMNKTSSRAHTVLQITLGQNFTSKGVQRTKRSRINIVDLAGSERVKKSGATGQRFRESVNINRSLAVLGDCIKRLSEKARGSSVHIPYRDTKLTWLLKESLQGNSKTVMIATVSPAADNFDETLNTLRYANRAKLIKTQARINVDSTNKVISDLRAEIESLRKKIAQSNKNRSSQSTTSDREVDALRSQIEQNQMVLQTFSRSWEEKLAQSRAVAEERGRLLHQVSSPGKRGVYPHFVNLHEDRVLSEVLAYYFTEPVTRVCGRGVQPPPAEHDLELKGLLIQPLHAQVYHTTDPKCSDDKQSPQCGVVEIEPQPDARLFINGKAVSSRQRLHHNDRIIMGLHHVFRFVHPAEHKYMAADQDKDEHTLYEEQKEEYDWEYAQKEVSETIESMQAMSNMQMGPQRSATIAGQTFKHNEEKIQLLRKQLAAARASVHSHMQEDVNAEHELEVQRDKELEALRKNHTGDKAKLQQKENDLLDEWKLKMSVEAEKRGKEKRQLDVKVRLLELELEHQEKHLKELNEREANESRDRMLLEERLMKAIPMVNEANAICEELKQNLKFSPQLYAHRQRDIFNQFYTQRTEVRVQVADGDGKEQALWSFAQFSERVFLMREIYSNYLEFPEVELTEDENPFVNLHDDDPQLIGHSLIYLKALDHLLEIDDLVPIMDYRGDNQGQLAVKVYPLPSGTRAKLEAGQTVGNIVTSASMKLMSASKGSGGNSLKPPKPKKRTIPSPTAASDFDLTEDESEFSDALLFEEEKAVELIDRRLDLLLQLPKAMGLPKDLSRNVYFSYRFFGDVHDTVTEMCPSQTINPQVGHERYVAVDPVTEEFVEYLDKGVLEVCVWGHHIRSHFQMKTPLNRTYTLSRLTPNSGHTPMLQYDRSAYSTDAELDDIPSEQDALNTVTEDDTSSAGRISPWAGRARSANDHGRGPSPGVRPLSNSGVKLPRGGAGIVRSSSAQMAKGAGPGAISVRRALLPEYNDDDDDDDQTEHSNDTGRMVLPGAVPSTDTDPPQTTQPSTEATSSSPAAPPRLDAPPPTATAPPSTSTRAMASSSSTAVKQSPSVGAGGGGGSGAQGADLQTAQHQIEIQQQQIEDLQKSLRELQQQQTLAQQQQELDKLRRDLEETKKQQAAKKKKKKKCVIL